MPILEATISKFKDAYSHLNGQNTVQLSRRRCLGFAKTVGLSMLRQAHDDESALALAVYRAMAVKCCLDLTGDKVRLQPGFSNLESSEKGNISFWIGMTMAAALADAYLKVPQLIHASQFGGYVARADPASRSLADFVGEDTHGNYHVIEAKGRVRVAEEGRAGWKKQAKTIAAIDGHAPATRSYCVARMSKRFRVELADPSAAPSGRRLHLSGSRETFGIKYYKPFVSFLEGDAIQDIVRNHRRLAVRVIAFDPQEGEYVFVGLTTELRDAVRARAPLPPRFVGFEEGDTYIGSDGTVITTGPDPCRLP